MSFMDFSSWPRDQEQTFVVYEQHTSDSQKKALTAGIIAAVGVLVLMLGIYAGVEPDHRDVTKDMNMSNLTKKTHPDTPAPAPSAAPSTDKK
jgi:hypothetical protein